MLRGPPGRPGRRPGSGRLLAFEVSRARAHYVAAEPGIGLLAPSSRPCVRVALELYGGILDEVEQAGDQVLGRRVRVPRHRRLGVAGRHWAAARTAARAERRVSVTTPGLPDPRPLAGRAGDRPHKNRDLVLMCRCLAGGRLVREVVEDDRPTAARGGPGPA